MNNKELIVNAKISSTYNELRKYYDSKSSYQIAGIERDENVHSNVIAWLLGDNYEHGLGYTPIKLFLMLISLCMDKEENEAAKLDYNNEPLLNLFITQQLDIIGLDIYREKVLGRDGAGYTKAQRIDILIELMVSVDGEAKVLPIIIENKVTSKEHKNEEIKQTNSYKAWADDEYSPSVSDKYLQPVFIYLTPDVDDHPSNPSFIKMTYQELIDKLIEPCLVFSTSDSAMYRIKDYLRCLTYADFEKSLRKGAEVVMGMSKTERDLLLKFKEDNKDLLLAIAAAIDEENEDAEVVKAVKSTGSAIKHRNNDKYVYKGDKYSKSQVVYQVIKDYVGADKVKDYNELKSLFEHPGSRDSHHLFILEAEYSVKSADQQNRFNENPITLLSGEIVYISKQIGSFYEEKYKRSSTNFENILPKFEALGIVLTKAED